MRIHPQTLGDLFVARILEYRICAADDDRHLIHGDVVALEHRLDAGIGFDVNAMIGNAVAAEKLLQTQRPRRVARSDQNDVASLRLDEPHAPQDEGAHEELTDLCVRLHKLAQGIMFNNDDLACLLDTRAHETARTAQRAHFTSEGSRPVQVHALFASKARPQNLDRPRKYGKHTPLALARLGEYFAHFDARPLPISLEPSHLRGR